MSTEFLSIHFDSRYISIRFGMPRSNTTDCVEQQEVISNAGIAGIRL